MKRNHFLVAAALAPGMFSFSIRLITLLSRNDAGSPARGWPAAAPRRTNH